MTDFAIETFGSTGRGRVVESGVCSHYGRNKTYDARHLKYVPHPSSILLGQRFPPTDACLVASFTFVPGVRAQSRS